VQVLALAVPFPGDPTPAELKEFRQKHKLTYPLLADPKGAVAVRFGASALPDNEILDRQGKLVAKPDDIDEVVKTLEKLTK